MKTGNLSPANPAGRRESKQYFPARIALIVLALLVSLGINWFLFGTAIQDRLTPSQTLPTGGRELSLDSSPLVGEARWGGESIAQRGVFSQIAWRMIRQNPVLGVGVGNFVVAMDETLPSGGARLLPYEHQPVHNIYLLIAAESGIAALIVFVFFLYNIVRPGSRSLIGLRPNENQTSLPGRPVISYTLLVIVIGLLFIGLFDHYLWTLQSGALLFWIILGLLAARGNKKTA